MVKAQRDNPVLDLARSRIAHARLDQSTRTQLDRHSLKGSRGPADSAAAQARNLGDVMEAVQALKADGFEVTWQKASGATGIHMIEIEWDRGDGMPVNAHSLGKKFSKNPVLELAHQEIAHAKLDGLKDATIDRHSLKGSHGPQESESARDKNLLDVKNAVAALRRDGYEVDWHKAQGPTGVHRLEISWWSRPD